MPVVLEYLWEDPSYDRLNNPDRRPIRELLPIGLSLTLGDIQRTHMFRGHGKAVELKKQTAVAVVETDSGSDAYIIDLTIKRILDVKNLRDKRRFFDVYYVEEELRFFFNEDNADYFITIDEANSKISPAYPIGRY